MEASRAAHTPNRVPGFRFLLVLGVVAAASLSSSCSSRSIAETIETPSALESAEPDVLAAVGFLQSLYDTEVGLIPMSDGGSMEVQGTKYPLYRIFWIYSDNFLASKALEPHDRHLSEALAWKIRRFGLPLPGYWEALFCKPIPEPPKVARILILKMAPGHVIQSEDHNDGPPLEGNYADVSIYRAVRLRDQSHLETARQMWDGIGLWDDATQADGLYASYKLALLLIGAKVLQADLPERSDIEAQLWSMQQTNGGITTFYDEDGAPKGTASTETTSLAILSAAPAWHCGT